MIQARSVRVEYTPGQPALDGVSLDIAAGEFVSLVGPSGCGKSTLLRLIAGLLAPTAGVLTVAGYPPQQASAQGHRVGFVFQDANLLPWRTVTENIRLPLELAGRPGREAEAAVRQSLQMIGLAEQDLGKKPRSLSGGMRMRVSLARALVTAPQVLLFDEPFAALDDLLRQQLNEELLSVWQRRPYTALFVTHNVAEAVFLSQRVLVMSTRPGAIVAEVASPLPHPRRRDCKTSPEFNRLVAEVSARLEEAAR